jgi:hypothetical protein
VIREANVATPILRQQEPFHVTFDIPVDRLAPTLTRSAEQDEF